MKKARKFYEGLAMSASTNGHVVDLFACSVYQVGLYEMKSLVNYTGGHMILCELFNSKEFLVSFQRVFARDEKGNLEMALNATLEIKTSQQLKVDNILGPCVMCKEGGIEVAGFNIGKQDISNCKMCALYPSTNISIFFEMVSQQNSEGQDDKGYIQFMTRYQQPSGQTKLRVTTICRLTVDPQSQKERILQGFDQEAAAVLMARMAIHKSETDLKGSKIGRYIDKELIHLSAVFADIISDNTKTCKFPENFNMYPEIFFHFRRSEFVQMFNISPDQTAFYNCMLNRESVVESLTMMQPELYSYSFSGVERVRLDTSAIQPERVLLLDTYFDILIYFGKTIVAWKKERYHEQEEYKSFRSLLERPVEDARSIISQRCPTPRYSETEHGGSQARILLSKVNPSHTHFSTHDESERDSWVLSEDINLDDFMKHLKRQVIDL